MNRILLVVALLLASMGSIAVAQQKDQKQDLEKRVMDLSSELRCLVCQNQTLADSNAPLAVDLRNTVREQLARGASEREVIDFMTARYGDFVLYRPPFKGTTILLWLGPFLLLAFGIFLFLRKVRKKGAEQHPLSDEDRERAARLLAEK